jgi:hypothetical protein
MRIRRTNCLTRRTITFALGLKSAAALATGVFEVAQRLNGMREEDVNELAANFPADQNGDSPSD